MHRISFRFHHRDGPRNELQDDRLKEKKRIFREKKTSTEAKKIKKKCRFVVSVNQLGKWQKRTQEVICTR